MTVKFKIVEIIETGTKYLAKPYWLDPSAKYSLFAKYTEGEEPVFEKWALNNEYKEDVKVVGDYATDKIHFSWENGIEYIKQD